MSLDAPLSQARFIILDTETTGTPPKAVELGAVEWTAGQKMRPEHFQETYINPQEKISPVTQAVHHILDEDVADAPLLSEVEQAWGEWVGDSPIVAYNSDFDRGVLEGTSMHPKRWVDAWRAAMHVCYIGQENEDGFALTSFKQQELRYWLKLPKTFGDAHRAAADIQVTAHLLDRVIQTYLECGNEDTQQAFLDWVDSPIQHMTLPIGGIHFAGKTPEQLADWALRKAFDREYFLFDGFSKFDVHGCLLPEYQKRFGTDPAGFGKLRAPEQNTTAPTGSFRPGSRPSRSDTSSPARGSSSSGTKSVSGAARWTRRMNSPLS